MKTKTILLTALIMIFDGSIATANQTEKKPTSQHTSRKVACDDSGANNEVLAHSLISQVVQKKLLQKSESYIYKPMKNLLQGLAGHGVENIFCDAVLNGASSCAIRVYYEGDEGGSVFYEMELTVSRSGKVTAASGKHAAPPAKPGVG